MFQNDLTGIESSMLDGYFKGWSREHSGETLYRVLEGSRFIWLAVEDDRVVGFINAIGDGFFSAFIPLLEVLPEAQGRGIGTELVRRMLDTLKDHYSVDLVCEDYLVSFYERLGLTRLTAMASRNYRFGD